MLINHERSEKTREHTAAREGQSSHEAASRFRDSGEERETRLSRRHAYNERGVHVQSDTPPVTEHLLLCDK